jgi:hypothetical protein
MTSTLPPRKQFLAESCSAVKKGRKKQMPKVICAINFRFSSRENHVMKVTIAALVASFVIGASDSRAADKDVVLLIKELRAVERQVAELEGQLKASKQSVETLTKLNKELMTQLDTLTKDIPALKPGKPPAPTDQPGALKAVVKHFEADGGIARLSIGQYKGVFVGQKLEVFRAQSGKRALGVFRILVVDETSAIGRLSGNIDPELKPGEEVTLAPASNR